jgi:hypothetical protein
LQELFVKSLDEESKELFSIFLMTALFVSLHEIWGMTSVTHSQGLESLGLFHGVVDVLGDKGGVCSVFLVFAFTLPSRTVGLALSGW